jgi:hypothetical protein
MLSQRTVRWLNMISNNRHYAAVKLNAADQLFPVFKIENGSSDDHDATPPDARVQLHQNRLSFGGRHKLKDTRKEHEPAHRQQNKPDKVPDWFHLRCFCIHGLLLTRREYSR